MATAQCDGAGRRSFSQPNVTLLGAHVVTKASTSSRPVPKCALAKPIHLDMSIKIRVGDRLTLPSGISVVAAFASDPSRPWRAHPAGTMWEVRREQGRAHVHHEAWHCYPDSTSPLGLTEADAAALAFQLNRVYPATPRKSATSVARTLRPAPSTAQGHFPHQLTQAFKVAVLERVN